MSIYSRSSLCGGIAIRLFDSSHGKKSISFSVFPRSVSYEQNNPVHCTIINQELINIHILPTLWRSNDLMRVFVREKWCAHAHDVHEKLKRNWCTRWMTHFSLFFNKITILIRIVWNTNRNVLSVECEPDTVYNKNPLEKSPFHDIETFYLSITICEYGCSGWIKHFV